MLDSKGKASKEGGADDALLNDQETGVSDTETTKGQAPFLQKKNFLQRFGVNLINEAGVYLEERAAFARFGL